MDAAVLDRGSALSRRPWFIIEPSRQSVKTPDIEVFHTAANKETAVNVYRR